MYWIFCSTLFTHLYKGGSNNDRGTLIQLRNLINRRNVANDSLVPRPSPAPVFDRLQYAKTGAGEGLGTRLANDVSGWFNASIDFFELVTKCHFVVAAMNFLVWMLLKMSLPPILCHKTKRQKGDLSHSSLDEWLIITSLSDATHSLSKRILS